MSFTLLIPSHNGATHLLAQLQSLAAQTHRPARLIVSDDGSADKTREILFGFARTAPFPVALKTGPCRGWPSNMTALIRHAPPDAPAAFADQDDAWLPDRLARAAAAFASLPPGLPALHCGRRIITDATLRPRTLSRLPRHPPGFCNAMVENVAPANTIALNSAALALARIASFDASAPAPFPDWWLYQLITGAGGQVIFDPAPLLYYRQHGANHFGAAHGLPARLSRLIRLFDGSYHGWRRAQIHCLSASSTRLTPAARAVLSRVHAGQHTRGVTRQSPLEQVALRLALALART
ncbi:glycosyltransferase [Aquicoccus sp. G2-2]|uniref:glycosyltransferase n=1 Tax=Aquicoccus sp. G2-2 TaxID=3092120 RepID=UPI002ADF8C1F|nr:glycosyltransferase [Aquicoccus sp. G2-2]MEA1115076.1 glycosyltransferase [Aquicoccus sp. G2-2]